MKQIRILKNFNLFLIYRVYLIVFATVLITYEQNYIYMYIQIYILKSFSFFSFFFRYVSTWKGNTENRWKNEETGAYFRTDVQLPWIFSTLRSITSPTHVYRLPYRLCVVRPPQKYQFSGGFNANFFGTWTNCSNLFSYCRSNRRPCQLVIIHRAKKRNREGRN